jgi:hypothetical protein
MPHTNTLVGDSFIDFDPNKLSPGSPVWAVYSNGRFKTYAKRGPALNAVMSNYRAKLYRMVGGRWDLVAVRDESNPPDVCSACGGSPKAAVDRYKAQYGRVPYYLRARGWQWEREPGTSKIPDPPVLLCLCVDCR